MNQWYKFDLIISSIGFCLSLTWALFLYHRQKQMSEEMGKPYTFKQAVIDQSTLFLLSPLSLLLLTTWSFFTTLFIHNDQREEWSFISTNYAVQLARIYIIFCCFWLKSTLYRHYQWKNDRLELKAGG